MVRVGAGRAAEFDKGVIIRDSFATGNGLRVCLNELTSSTCHDGGVALRFGTPVAASGGTTYTLTPARRSRSTWVLLTRTRRTREALGLAMVRKANRPR